ncbi:MAG TPA: cytochrome c oxidase subunit II [Thermoleophilaceae bacterium]
MRKHPIAQMLTIGVVASLIGIAIVLNIHWFPKSADTAAHPIDTLYDVLLICSVPIFVLVMTVAIYSVVKFRARPGDMSDGAPIHGNTRLEVIWVTIPFLMVTALAIYGWVVLNNVEAKKPNERMINVVGQQFTWHFQYAKNGATADPGPCGASGPNQVTTNELVLQKDQPVYFRICTKDVIHSFWVPEFRLKQDAVPGINTHMRLTPNRDGTYAVVCAELCGLGHSTMRSPVHVLNGPQFATWLKQQVSPPATAGGGAAGGGAGGGGAVAAQGKQLFTANGCGGCHTLAAAGGNGTVGPNLNNLAASAAKFGKQLGETPQQYVSESIANPGKFTVPGFPKGVMPSTFGQQLSPQQLDALVKYLLSVGKG